MMGVRFHCKRRDRKGTIELVLKTASIKFINAVAKLKFG